MLISGMNSAITIVPTINGQEDDHDRLEQRGEALRRQLSTSSS